MSSEGNAEGNPVVFPQHVAIIMDGNGRWAKSRHLPRVEGHRQGAKTVRMVVEESRRIGIKYLTLFAFSSENWSRPQDEVSTLMKLLQHYLEREIAELTKNGVRLRAIGDLGRLPDYVQEALLSATKITAENDSLNLTLAISYGGRDEILHVIRQIALKVEQGELSSDDLDVSIVRSFLYDPDLPDIDLLIRTSGESRISNFMLWQLAYSEIVIDTVYWPDFSKERYQAAMAEFSRRSRRFGKTQEQIG
jgi:undecaprenyl diphosphate synthase